MVLRSTGQPDRTQAVPPNEEDQKPGIYIHRHIVLHSVMQIEHHDSVLPRDEANPGKSQATRRAGGVLCSLVAVVTTTYGYTVIELIWPPCPL